MESELHAIVKKAKQGDHEAFTQLIARFKGQAFRHAFAMLHDRDELPLAERIDVKKHLDACVSCKTVLQELSSMQRDVFAAYRSLLLPENLEEHIRTAVFDQNKSAYPSTRYAGLYSLPIISAILLCALLVLARALLSLSVIGIPVALFILAVLVLFFFIGLAATALWIGRMIPALEGHLPLSSLAGAAVLIAGFNFPFFGFILFVLVVCLSMGMMGLWVRGKFRGAKRNSQE